MKNDNIFIHAAIAAAISFGISIYAWLGLGVFLAGPFWAVSTGVAAIAVLAGWLSGRRLLVTAFAAFLLRAGVLALALQG